MADHKNLAQALAAFQAEVPKMSRDERAKVKGETKDGRTYDRSYDYAGLDQFVEIVEPVLGKHGLSVSATTEWNPQDGLVAVVSLLHEGGESRDAFWPLPNPAQRGVGPQDVGSALTYARRYLGWGLTGTFPGGADDDGAQAQRKAESWENAQPRQQQSTPAHNTEPKPSTPPKQWTDDELRVQHQKLTALPLEQAAGLYDWMGSRNLHKRAVRHIVGDEAEAEELNAGEVLARRLANDALNFSFGLDAVEAIREVADSRGLLKIPVSATEDLGGLLVEARELRLTTATGLDAGAPPK